VNNATERDAKEDGECATDGDVPDRLLKHPLQNRWAFWYYKNDKHKDWKENQKIITTFDTVEDFWAYVKLFQIDVTVLKKTKSSKPLYCLIVPFSVIVRGVVWLGRIWTASTHFFV